MTNELKMRVQKLQKEGQSYEECLEQVVSLGCYQLEYRRIANPKKSEQQKEARRILKIAQSDPELSVRLGLGTRPTL